MPMSTSITEMVPDRNLFTGERRTSPKQLPRRDVLAIRALDIGIASILLIFLAPLLLVIALIIGAVDRGPVIFAQRRLGQNGQSFPCFKFRTMVANADRRLHQLLATDRDAREEWTRDFRLRRDPRITALGNFLRKSSIDELPQLINVLRGEMSIVGPRPIVEDEIDRYGRYFAHYRAVKPGLTGLWRVSGRNATGYRRRVALDVSYMRNKCLRLDLQILAMTVVAVLLGKESC